jgi:hypothetical protein
LFDTCGSDWTGLKIMSLGHRTIGFQFCLPMSPVIVWTLQTGGNKCGDDNVNVSMMPTPMNMTVMVVVTSWSGVESAGSSYPGE